METKEDLIRDAIRQLLRLSQMYARIEAMPIPVEKDLEVSTREAHTIQAVGEQERISVTALAAHFGITKSATSQMVTRLVKRGFLLKRPAAHSGKEFELTLTDLGWKAFDAHEHFHGRDMSLLVERLTAFPISQVATLQVLLEALGGVMEKRIGKRTDT